jgi:radical SAM protein with 4Fe4S-binding SPASM domain
MNALKEKHNKKIKVDNWETFQTRVQGKRGVKVDGCHAGYSSLCVDSNGDLYPCPALNGDGQLKLGNVVDGLRSVWMGSDAKMQDISVIDLEGCRACEFRYFCGGGCRCQAYCSSDKKDLKGKDPYCSVIKGMLLESILTLISPNGHGRPEILGHMMDFETENCCGGPGQVEVSPFHCTCFLDLKTDMHSWTRSRYTEAALKPEDGLCCPTGYSKQELEGVPKDTISISYGCGNPTSYAELKKGESVLDIGSGGGIDCFIAAKIVGSRGKVIGVDMTDEMLEKASKNNDRITEFLGYDVVEFRKGLIEKLPVESLSIDLAISNCVINLSPDKERVVREIYRVLKKGGRFSISDIFSDRKIPEAMLGDRDLWSGCISGALKLDEFLKMLRDAGFRDVSIEKSVKWKEVGGVNFYSAALKGRKP